MQTCRLRPPQNHYHQRQQQQPVPNAHQDLSTHATVDVLKPNALHVLDNPKHVNIVPERAAPIVSIDMDRDCICVENAASRFVGGERMNQRGGKERRITRNRWRRYMYRGILFLLTFTIAAVTACCCWAMQSFSTNTDQTTAVAQPVFVLSLPKSGTTTMYQYFTCGGYKAVHHRHRSTYIDQILTRILQRDMGTLVGKCMQHNLANYPQQQRSLLEGCGTYQVWTDMSYCEDNEKCFFPSIHALEEMYQSYPNATWILSTRNGNDWYNSISTFLSGYVLEKWEGCFRRPNPREGKANSTATTDSKSFWIDFYEQNTARVRSFAEDHPSLRYIEIGLEDDDAASRLNEEFDIPNTCFGRYRRSSHPGNILLDGLESVMLWMTRYIRNGWTR